MAIAAFDNVGGGTSGSFTCNGNIILCNTDNGTTSVTYGGQALTKIGGSSIFTWYLLNPPTGSNTCSANGSRATFISYTNSSGYGSFTDTTYGPNGTSVSGISTSQVSSKIVGFVSAPGANSPLTSTTGTIRLNGWNTLVVDEINAPTVTSYTELVQWNTANSVSSYSNLVEVKSNLGFSFTGPASGNVNAASTNFTVTPDVAVTGTVTITPTGAGSTGLSSTVLTFSGSATPQTFTITPLTSGSITLTMTNGCGLNNAAPLTYTAIAVAPGAPVIGTATSGNTNASVAFSAPSSDGGATITNYTATSTPGTFTGTGASSPITVSGLTNGVAYTFKVKATNSAGTGPESSASNSVTPFVPATTFTFTGPSSGNVRSASTNFTVTPNSTYYGTITLTPTGAGSTGLNPVVLTWSGTSTAQTFTITPLTSGLITLTPTNSNGLANPANLNYTANAVVPLPPSMGLAIASQGSAFVTIGAPTNNGGSAITLYTVTSSPGGITATSPTAGTITVNGLTNGTAYTFTATATNVVGTSSASSASNSIRPTAASTAFANNGPKFTSDRSVGNTLSF